MRTPLQLGDIRSDFGKNSEGIAARFSRMNGVWKNGDQLLNRPFAEDKADPDRLTQTFLEQINVNADFREIARSFNRSHINTWYPNFYAMRIRFRGRS